MGKKKTKMNLSSLLLSLPLCHNNANKTLSFRLSNVNSNDIIKTVNSVFFDSLETETPESWFTNSSESASHSTESDSESLETVVRGVVRSERLFFDPGVTSSILKSEPESKSDGRESSSSSSIEEISVAVAMESEDPYSDFRRSMEEMVNSHEELVKDWESLEAMLAWYLKMNGKKSHGVIVSAFVDLLAGIGAGNSDESARYSTAVSSSLPSSPFCGSNQTEIEEEEEEEERPSV